MAPPSTDWQNILRIQPADIEDHNETEDDQYDNFATSYAKVIVVDDYFL
jgi:hypothetical protein